MRWYVRTVSVDGDSYYQVVRKTPTGKIKPFGIYDSETRALKTAIRLNCMTKKGQKDNENRD